ncbi:MAG TPA: hypothetical protein VFK32_00295 [Tepidiformaceae bacterium]|jgi:hypothetical protein|nr:hypothetical protein [Tepidiformaceae bacterium]
MMGKLLKVVLLLAALWVAFVGIVYQWMRKPPEEFAARMAKLPMPAMMAFPFETMWSSARGGSLEVGGEAPDFELDTLDRKSKVKLSAYRGERPVVLVFGSYT